MDDSTKVDEEEGNKTAISYIKAWGGKIQTALFILCVLS